MKVWDGLKRGGGRALVVAVLLLMAMGLPMAAGGALAGDEWLTIDEPVVTGAPIVMRAYHCAQGAETRAELLGQCTLVNGVYFMSNDVDGYSGASGQGLLVWPSVSPRTVLLAEEVPGWAETPRVFCGVSQTAGVPPLTWAEKVVSQPTEMAGFYVARGLNEYVFCDWFNVRSQGSRDF